MWKPETLWSCGQLTALKLETELITTCYQNGMTHAFVVQFSNAPDRDYYVRIDPAHQEFVKSLDGIIEKAQAIDYTPGVF